MSQDNGSIKVERNQRQAAREQLITSMLQGRTFEEASKEVDAPLKRAMAYRLLRAVRTQGEIALQDGRHGHPITHGMHNEMTASKRREHAQAERPV